MIRGAGRALAPLVAVLVLLLAGPAAAPRAAAPIAYRFTITEPEHHWMQVEATFPDLDATPLELRMSRSSPGRYSIHDFAKNVYDVRADGPDGRDLPIERPDPSGWTVPQHGAAVTVRYKIFGDRVDGTYLAIDRTHLHMNMPAAIMWAHGLDDRPATLTFAPPAGAPWRLATQLHDADGSGLVVTAPNLQYLMDSPVEFGPVAMRQFTVGSRTFRFALHHLGTDGELDGYVGDVQKIVREEGAIYGEFPAYEPQRYTFLADYLPWANGDGMEHRNSTVMTSPGSIAGARERLLGTVAHEFFHCWNVERIRPRGLEPFDFDRANMTRDLWLAEGFTQYYAPLVLARSGIDSLADTLGEMAALIDGVTLYPGRSVRSAVDMSRMAPFTDGGRPVDRTNWSNTVISYYTYGGAIALGLDLSLRARSDGRLSLDDFMRAMWRKYGKPGATREGYVDHPYTLEDAEATLAEVSGDPAFAHDFFAHDVAGHDVADYRSLLANAGFVLRRRSRGRAWWGDVRVDARSGDLRIAGPVLSDWPAYAAGLDQDDELRQMDGERLTSPDQVAAILSRHKVGDRVQVTFVDRTGQTRIASVQLADDPRNEIVPAETAGTPLTAAQRTFRAQWLGSKAR